MKNFILKEYTIHSKKIEADCRNPVMVMISDLHNVSFGEHNERLMAAIDKIAPDAILLAGDIVLGKPNADISSTVDFLRQIDKRGPVFYAPGNHEYRMKIYPRTYGDMYTKLKEQIDNTQIIYLENESAEFKVGNTAFAVHGLALEFTYYKKRRFPILSNEQMQSYVGTAKSEAYHILLAHNPYYGRAYMKWGADLTLAGHYHGGIVRLPYFGGVISPALQLFPKYCHGRFQENGNTMIVGAGMGEHTIPVRINNKRELVVLRFAPM